MGAGFTRGKWTTREQLLSTRHEDADNLLSASILDALARVFAREDNSFNPGVVSGFVTSASVGTMDCFVTSGLAFARDNSVLLTDYTDSRWAMMLTRSTETVPLDPGDAQDRIDVIYLQPQETDSRVASSLIYNIATKSYGAQAVNQERRNDPVFGVSKGVPGGVPVAPAIPAGAIKLVEVTVPAGAVNLAAATVTDSRELIGRLGSYGREETWAAGRVTVIGAAIGPFTSQNVAGVVYSGLGIYDVSLTLPVRDLLGATCYVTAQTGVPAIVAAIYLNTSTIRVRVWSAAGAAQDSSFAFRAGFIRD